MILYQVSRKKSFHTFNFLSSLESNFVETMYNAFWDHLKDQLSKTPPDFSCALELISNIKQVSSHPSLC